MNDEEFYASSGTLLGALQRGLGRGVTRAMHDPDAARPAVLSCLRRDHRWWWTVDERAVYLARLVRDLEIPVAQVLAVLDATPPEDDENAAGLTLEVLEVLGRAGNREATEAVRRHTPEGPHPIEAAPGERPPAPVPDPTLAEARRWTTVPDHPRYWPSAHVLAGDGEERDVPALLEVVNRVPTRTEGLDRCYRGLIEGLARIGGDEAAQVVPRLRSLWFTPHTYERAAVLHALLTFAPADEHPRYLIEGLEDCEADVRELAVAHVELTDRTRRCLAYLRDDPMETPEVRAAAARRLDRSG
ncbi:hypothetical protein BJF79_13040 [Actinomadura sp. CNU-125]|uniref:hypothetical protein n=1 Tax=Actinomadura sp. CNU-125 TaxID=1904961 RepID=UPI00096843AC|nr:hypothetical protein [Actinomadura sp. CNU-125]OLT25084.1 hypothetical protein BJF79_13040 [Actinomadura sp. CNU-125]